MSNLISEAEKNALGMELRAKMAECAAIAARLGVEADLPKDGRKSAPDGGPQSSIHTRMKTQMEVTMEVRLRRPGRPPAIIRARDFDPAKHEALETTGSRRRSEEGAAE